MIILSDIILLELNVHLYPNSLGNSFNITFKLNSIYHYLSISRSNYIYIYIHIGFISSVAFSCDGKYLATGS